MANNQEKRPLTEFAPSRGELVQRCDQLFEQALFDPAKLGSVPDDEGYVTEYVLLMLGDESLVLSREDVTKPNAQSYPYYAEEALDGFSADGETFGSIVMHYPVDVMGGVNMALEEAGKDIIVTAPAGLSDRIAEFIQDGELEDLE